MKSTGIISKTYRDLRRYRDYLVCATRCDLRIQFSDTYLGVVWWLLDPLMFMLVFVVVFQFILQRGEPGFAAFVLNALLPWKWTSTVISNSATSITSKANILQQVYVPKFLLPLEKALVGTGNFLVGCIVLIALNLYYGSPIGLHWLGAIPVMVSQLTMLLAIAFLIAHLGVFFRDIQNVLSFTLRLWFYLSPTFYSIERIPESYRFIWWLNPLTTYYTSYRRVFMHGQAPLYRPLAIWFLLSLLVIMAGLSLLNRFDRSYTKLS